MERQGSHLWINFLKSIETCSLSKYQNRRLNSPSEFHTPKVVPRKFDFLLYNYSEVRSFKNLLNTLLQYNIIESA